MRICMLAAGAAALAITAPALAQQGGGHGRGGGKEKSAQVERGGGKKNDSARASRQGGGDRELKASRGGDRERGKQDVRQARSDDHKPAKAFHARDEDNRGRGQDKIKVRRADRDDDKVRVRGVDRDRDPDFVLVRDFDDDDFDGRWGGRGFARGFVNGCPPGLAKKNDECLPPGQYKKLVGTVIPATYSTRSLFGPYRDWYRDDDRFIYRMGPDGYIYRVNRADNLIDALIPSYMDDFAYYPVGMAYPSYYNSYNVPMQYSGYWPDDDDYYYRYGNGAIYQVDPRTSMIQSIVALLAGDLSVGQRLPPAYGVYNVPYGYRDQYYDTPDAWYRYNDGYIYRVDPTTQLITAVIRALV